MSYDYRKLSDTRGVDLTNLAALCYILIQQSIPISVHALALQARELEIPKFEEVRDRDRLPTRVNHHMIALRDLCLVDSTGHGPNRRYSLTPIGRILASVVQQVYRGRGRVPLTRDIEDELVRVLVDSPYVRYHWLKYFMPHSGSTYQDDFSRDDLVNHGQPVTLIRVPANTRLSEDDSGLRIHSSGHKLEVELNELARREIYQGLCKWTNTVHLTDDLVTVDAPFAYQSEASGDNEFYEIDYFIVKKRLSIDRDLAFFEEVIQSVFQERGLGNRITLPEIIIILCRNFFFCKDDIKDMLGELFYKRNERYFFERSSEFLIRRAFSISKRNPESEYYIQLEGIWRSSIVYYG